MEAASKYEGEISGYDIFLEEYSDIRSVYNKYQKRLCNLKSDFYFLKNGVSRIKEEGFSSVKKCIIGFGTGNCFERNVEKVLRCCNLSYLTDNNPDKWGQYYHDLECIPPMKVPGFNDVFVLIFTDDVGISFDIARQLMNMGVYNFDHVNNYLNEVSDYDK